MVITHRAEALAVLADTRYIPPPVRQDAPEGTLAWLRSHASRFSTGEVHARQPAAAGGVARRPRPGRAPGRRQEADAGAGRPLGGRPCDSARPRPRRPGHRPAGGSRARRRPPAICPARRPRRPTRPSATCSPSPPTPASSDRRWH
ncbi:hypothetical protein ACFSTC_45075 [Nonomuraea ferruginea]